MKCMEEWKINGKDISATLNQDRPKVNRTENRIAGNASEYKDHGRADIR